MILDFFLLINKKNEYGKKISENFLNLEFEMKKLIIKFKIYILFIYKLWDIDLISSRDRPR